MPVDVTAISAEVRQAMANRGAKVIHPDGARRAEESGIRPYEDPVMKGKKARLHLAGRMWRSGMLTTLLLVESYVSLFSVVKESEGAQVTGSRLVFDFRGINYRFMEPPWTPHLAALPWMEARARAKLRRRMRT